MMDRGIPSRLGPEIAPPEELLARIRAAIAATPAPKTTTRLRATVAAALVPVVIAMVLVIASALIADRPALRVDIGTVVASPLLLVLLLLVGVALSATRVTVRRRADGFGPGVIALSAVALLVTPIYAALILLGPAGTGETGTNMSPWGLRCLAVAASVGVLVLVGFTAALRGAAPAASRLRGAALGAAAGAWAGLTVFVFCPATELPHLLVGHVMPIAACTLLGLGAVPRVLRP